MSTNSLISSRNRVRNLNNTKRNITKRKILLTGATGYLGSNLLLKLCGDYDFVVLKRRKSNTFRIAETLNQDSHPIPCFDIEDLNFSSFFREQEFFGVIHCATNYGRDENDLVDTIEANLILPLRLLKLSLEYRVEFFMNTDTILDKGINYYSLSKSQFKDWLSFFSDRIKAINVELEHFYGKGDDPTKFVSRIIHEMVRNESRRLPLTLGEQKRSFVFIDDAVNAFALILSHIPNLSKKFTSYQVASKKQISIKEFVHLTQRLCENTQIQLDFGVLPYRKNEVMEVSLDLSPLEALGWKERTSLEEGLKQAIDYQRTRP